MFLLGMYLQPVYIFYYHKESEHAISRKLQNIFFSLKYLIFYSISQN